MLAGWFFVMLGLIGAVLPVVPTTCFLIVALACFTRGSPRLANWLLNHPRFGGPLREWQAHGVISPPTKRIAIAGLLLAWTITTLVSSGWLVPLSVGLVLTGVGVYILTRPEICPVRLEMQSSSDDGGD